MRKIGPSWPGCKNQKRCLCVLTDIRGQDCYLRTDALTVQPVCDVPTWFCPSFSFPPFLQKFHGACTQISFHQTFKEASTLVDPCQFYVVINISNLITFLDALCYDIGQTYQILIFFISRSQNMIVTWVQFVTLISLVYHTFCFEQNWQTIIIVSSVLQSLQILHPT